MTRPNLVLKDLRQIHKGLHNGWQATVSDGRVLRFDNEYQARHALLDSGILCLGFNFAEARGRK